MVASPKNTPRETKEETVVVSCAPLMANQYLTKSQTDSEESPVKSYKGLCCQVCLFEGRKIRTKSVAYCPTHGVRACLSTPDLLAYADDKFKTAVEVSTQEELALWKCPDTSMSCWSKAHTFYGLRGLWGQKTTTPTTAIKILVIAVSEFRRCSSRIEKIGW